MFPIGDRDCVSRDPAPRAKAGFRAPVVDDTSSDRILSAARLRATDARRLFPRALVVRVGVVLVVAAVLFAAFELRPSRGPFGAPIQTANAAVVLHRALAAVSQPGDVLHVVAATEATDLPIPQPPKTQPPRPGIHWGGMRAFAVSPPVQDRIEAEHWLDRARNRRLSVQSRLVTYESGAWSRQLTELLEVDGVRTNLLSTKSSGSGTSTMASQNSVNDTASTADWALPDQQVESPEAQLRDTSDPSVYFSVLSGGTLNTPRDVDGKPTVTRDRATLLGQAVVDGVPVYRLQIVSSSYWRISRGGVDTTLVADVRRSDYFPVRVEGVWTYFGTGQGGRKTGGDQGQRWVTVYHAVESVPPSHFPDSAFRIDIPKGVAVQSNLRVPPDQVASSTPFPVEWLGQQFDALRFTGSFRKTSGAREYELMVLPDSAPLMADDSRPKISPDQVVAEYTPSGAPSNMLKDYTGTSLKVLSMPRTDPSTWEAAFQSAQEQMPGDRDDAWIMRRSWTTVASRRALLLHHEYRWGNGTVHGRVVMTTDYLVFQMGDSTVMVQGACTKPGLVERAAEAMVPVG